MPAIVCRRAGPGDAPAVSAIHVAGWRWGYRGLLPATMLAGLSFEERRALWERLLAPDSGSRVWVACRGEDPVGFAAWGRARDDDVGDRTAEVYALYRLEDAGPGVGAGLLRAVTDEMRAAACSEAVLWVLATNARGRRFYERCGWLPDGREKVEDGEDGAALHEVRYRLALASR